MKKIFLYLLSLSLYCSCTDDNTSSQNFDHLKADASVTDPAGNVYEVGYEQVSSINQNPFVLKKGANGAVIWKVNHEQTPVDGRAVFVGIDQNDRIWVVFSVDGGSTESTSIVKFKVENNAFNGVYMNSYGSGGGAKVGILAEINPANGNIKKGTFLTARLNNGKTNSLTINKMGFNETGILLETSTAAWPPGTGKSYKKYPDITDADRINNFFQVKYKFSYDLSEILSAEIKK
ncbi:MAG: hypothetical protein ACFCUU_00395 [Cyclobacteriaceae bacterium]